MTPIFMIIQRKNKKNFDKLVKETREAVANADASWKKKTVKKYGETEQNRQ
ncbi:coagulase domain-containing protein [Staphylococcus aureus]